jgi:choice-of-anchor B domain-containing protein
MKLNYKITVVIVFMLLGILANGQASLNVTQQSHLSYGNQSCANIFTYVDASGNEYALNGAAQGLSIVNVTNPATPVIVSQIPNVDNLWKEIKTYQNFAYVTTEGGGGLQIVDLSTLPLAPTTYYNYTGDGVIAGLLDNIHALHIDTTLGFCYLFGSNLFSGGAVVLDLNVDPYNPTYVGHYTNPAYNYIHDGYVDNDTLYAGHIYDGYMSVVDMTNKAAPAVLALQQTTTAFTHNTWPSNNKKFIFTTDENTNSFLTSYNISNLNNIQETDKIQSQFPNSGSIVHNTHILNNWAVTSWYRDGFVITDITRPYNLINVGWFDNYTGSGNGFNGVWGVNPFLPSGTIVVSNIEDGLYVYDPTYVRACYLEGTVKDSICNTPLSGVTVTISTVNVTEVSDLNGVIRTGTAIPGTYTVTFTKPGYQNYVINNLVFSPGVVDTFNIKMISPTAILLAGNLSDSITNIPIVGAQVQFYNVNANYNFVSDVNGDYSNCSVVAGNYLIAAAAWGYQTICTNDSLGVGSNTQNFQLTSGYQDDFTFDLGWTVVTTSTSGAWERGEPVGTTYQSTQSNPEFDVTGDCTDQCYVTGNAGGNVGSDDVDNGTTTLTSPLIDMTTYFDPYIHYSRWFFNDGGNNTPNDSLVISLSDGISTMLLEKVIATSPGNSTWVPKNIRVLNYFPNPTATMRLIVSVADSPSGNLVEAAFDDFNVADSSLLSLQNNLINSYITVYPNPFNEFTTVAYSLNSISNQGAFMDVRDITGRLVNSQIISAIDGKIEVGTSLSEGIYFVRIINGNEISKTVRLVKSR